MKTIIYVQSCVRDALNGANQAIRDTWATRLPDGWDLRFFIGTTLPGPVELEHPNWQKDYRNLCAAKPQATKNPPLMTQVPKDDEILVRAPDDYPHMCYKTIAIRKWILEGGYDRIFKCDTDTAIDFRRFRDSGQDYSGVPDEGWDARTENHDKLQYAFGGNGYWMGSRPCELSLTEPVFTLAEDVWTGLVLKNPHGILLTPEKLATQHLGTATASYRAEQMYRWWEGVQ